MNQILDEIMRKYTACEMESIEKQVEEALSKGFSLDQIEVIYPLRPKIKREGNQIVIEGPIVRIKDE